MEWMQTLTPVDYFFLTLLLIGAVTGWIKGLVGILTGFVAFLAAAFLAGRYAAVVVEWLNTLWNVEGQITDSLASKLHLPAMAPLPATETLSWSKALEYLQGLPLPAGYKETLAQRIVQEPTLTQASDIGGYVAGQLAGGALRAVVFLVMMAVLTGIFLLLGRLISEQIKEIPLVGTTNRILGSSLILLEITVILSLTVGLLAPMLAVYGAGGLQRLFEPAQLTPLFLSFYTWLRGLLFGLASGTFFAI